MSKESCKTVAIKKVLIPRNKLIKNKDVIKSGLCREDVLYESVKGDFLNLDTPCIIVNKLNLITKNSMTAARFEDGAVWTSENISKVIGQNKYDTVLSALCTIISHELKIRALLALLTIPKKTRTVSCQTEVKMHLENMFTETSCQTEESSIMMYKKDIKRVKRRQVTPYVVTEANKKKVCNKVTVYPGPFYSLSSRKILTKPLESGSSDKNESLPLLELDNDNSNDSVGQMSTFTVNSIPEILNDPLGLLDIDKVIAPESIQPTFDWSNNTTLTLLDGTQIQIPVKIEDDFHVATPEILKMVAPEYRKKLLWYQVYLDWKHCLTRDEEDCLPIHVAASNGDSDLVRRQCSVLKSRNESVDITTDDNLTALQISIYRNHPRCAMTLLFFGADPLVTDDEYRTCFHLAAEADPGHLKGLLKYCFMNPMKILRENEEMWSPELESKPKVYLIKYLLRKISVLFDNQGYTPLMLASKLGKYENVKMLAEASPHTINSQMPNSGNTALYLAVGSACLNAINRCNKSTVSDEFRKTIETLVELGADPAIDNHSGSNVNTLLTDLHVGELSMIIANKMTTINCMDLEPNTSNEVGVLHKDEHGNIVSYEKLRVKKIKNEYEKNNTPLENSKEKVTISKEKKDKPNILQNIIIESTVPIIKERETPEIKTVIKTEPKSPIPKKRYKLMNESTKKSIEVDNKTSDYMNTFKNFVSAVNNAKIASPMPVIESENLGKLITDSSEEYNSKKDDLHNSGKTILIAKNAIGSNSEIIENEKRLSTYHEFIETDSSEDDSVKTIVIAKNGNGSNSEITHFENKKRLQNTHNIVINYGQVKASINERLRLARKGPLVCTMKRSLDSSDSEETTEFNTKRIHSLVD